MAGTKVNSNSHHDYFGSRRRRRNNWKIHEQEDVQISAAVVDLCLAPFITFAWSQNATAAETETLLSVLCTQPENMQSSTTTADWFSLSVDLLFDQPYFDD